LEDWILWVAGFVGVVLLLALLIWRGGAKVFPWLAASCAYQIVQSVTLYLIHLKGPYKVYFWTYWYGRIPEHFLVLSVIWNLGFVLLHPKEHWKARSKEVLAIGGGIALLAAIVLTWMSEPQSAVAMTRFLIRTNLFASILTTELAATVILTALVLKCGWTKWTKGLAVGMLLQFPINFAVEVAHTYFGETRFYYGLVHIEGYAEIAALCVWIFTFSRKETEVQRFQL